MMKLCIYHGGCTDGVAAAWAVHSAKQGWGFYPGAYQQEPPWEQIEKAKQVCLVDFSYKRPVMEQIIERCPGKVTVLDHHATARDDLEPLLSSRALAGEFDMDRCGAMMAWDWFHTGQKPPTLLPYIDARDRWVKDADLKHTLDHVTMALRSYSHTDPIDFDLWTVLMFSPKRLADEGVAIHRYYRTLVEDAKRRSIRVTLGEYENVPCVNAPYNLASEVAGELAEDSTTGIAFVWWQNSDRSFTASLRSRGGGPDVGKIATQWGGGGHPGAAGFRVEVPVWQPA